MAKRYVRIGWRRYCAASIKTFLRAHPTRSASYCYELKRHLAWWRRVLFRRSLERDDLPWIIRDALDGQKSKLARLGALRVYLRYLERMGILKVNPCARLTQKWFVGYGRYVPVKGKATA